MIAPLRSRRRNRKCPTSSSLRAAWGIRWALGARHPLETKNVVISGGFRRDSEEARASIDSMLALGERADCDGSVLRKIQTDMLQREQAEHLDAIRKCQQAM